MEMSFKDLVKFNESVQGEYTKKIRQAKKGECAVIMKELEELFKDRKINQAEFDMLTAMCGRQMDKLNESNINKDNWKVLKDFFTKSKGFKSWEFEGDYEVLLITFDNGKNAANALDKSVNSSTEITAFGDVSQDGKVITVELNNDSMKALDESSKPSDFKKGDSVKWASTFGSREQDMEGKIVGFKDHEDYKDGYLIIKGSDGKEYKKIFSSVSLNENVDGINNNGIGYIITYSMYMIAQTHIWHLLCTSGQKHTALKEMYEELQDEVDELAERFIAQGGELQTVNEPIIAKYDDLMALQRINEYRNMVTSCIDTRPEMASIIDGIVDLQEVIDSKLYKFKMN